MGRLRVRDWDNGERAGTSVEIEAETVGHDLLWGSSTFVRTVHTREAEIDPMPEDLDETKPKSKTLANK
jgi:single-strand DNA-binding protein